ncbi:MAG: DNA topoisomerase III [Oleispira sp.]|nr:DNA topoisomerase III [Oleispira sp.]
MKLYIAEKPSLGRAIADGLTSLLNKPQRKQQGYIELANGDVVSWCIGHLLEQAEPDSYDPAFKSWKLEHLPIVPQEWQLKAKSQTRSQLTVLRKLVKQADQIVHAGDPDREGQLLVDEVLSHLKISAHKRKNTQRCLISDLNPPAVKRALENLRSNQEFIPLSVSALSRSRADWLYGMNMTRAYTLQGQKAGYQGVLSVGRVQTPLLGLVVKRDEEIKNFISRDFYQVEARLVNSDNESFLLKWQPSEACKSYQDEEGRVLHKPLVENVCQRIAQQPAEITKVEQKDKQQPPPLPFNLSTLQIEAAKAFAMSAQQVLDTCQSLYERHQLITYPRSDSRHLPAEQHSLAPNVIQAIGQNCQPLQQYSELAQPHLKSKAFNDSKVEAHHAIVPSEKSISSAQFEKLNQFEQKVYRHIARQYLMQFFPPYQYAETKVEAEIAGGLFKTQAKQPLKLGWKALYGDKKSTNNKSAKQTDSIQTLPPINLDPNDNQHGKHAWLCDGANLIEKQTTPPEHFNDGTLLAAMTGIARYVTNAEIRKTLKETDGLGTEATRAGIIELLFKRSFLQRIGKQIHSTEVGRGLINSLPESAITPDMTALWEQQLNAISQRELNYQGFMQPLNQHLLGLIEQAKQHIPAALQGLKGQGQGFKRKAGKKKSPARKYSKKTKPKS